MGKITEKLKKLGLTVNGTTPTGETISETIDNIADDYTGGSGATYTAGNGIAITEENVINADVKVIETSNITGLTTEQCEALNVGDVVVKLTSNQKHTYTVSYKEAGVGMCLTYVDASTSETVSYDYTGGQWVYNSTDITPLKNIVANPTLAGTEDDLTGLQVGETKYKVPQGGSGGNLYMNSIFIVAGDFTFGLNFNTKTLLSTEDFLQLLKDNYDGNKLFVSGQDAYGNNIWYIEYVLDDDTDSIHIATSQDDYYFAFEDLTIEINSFEL